MASTTIRKRSMQQAPRMRCLAPEDSIMYERFGQVPQPSYAASSTRIYPQEMTPSQFNQAAPATSPQITGNDGYVVPVPAVLDAALTMITAYNRSVTRAMQNFETAQSRGDKAQLSQILKMPTLRSLFDSFPPALFDRSIEIKRENTRYHDLMMKDKKDRGILADRRLQPITLFETVTSFIFVNRPKLYQTPSRQKNCKVDLYFVLYTTSAGSFFTGIYIYSDGAVINFAIHPRGTDTDAGMDLDEPSIVEQMMRSSHLGRKKATVDFKVVEMAPKKDKMVHTIVIEVPLGTAQQEQVKEVLFLLDGGQPITLPHTTPEQFLWTLLDPYGGFSNMPQYPAIMALLARPGVRHGRSENDVHGIITACRKADFVWSKTVSSIEDMIPKNALSDTQLGTKDGEFARQVSNVMLPLWRQVHEIVLREMRHDNSSSGVDVDVFHEDDGFVVSLD